MTDPQRLRETMNQIASKREFLLRLLEQPNLGMLRIDELPIAVSLGIRIDVNQAIEEMDDLIDEFKATFPDSVDGQTSN